MKHVFRLLNDRLIRIAALLVLVLFIGVAGYQLLEDWSVLDSLYMTVITIASVGFGETHPLSDAGRIFTIFLILGGGGVLVYGFSSVTAFIVEGDLSDVLRKRKMQRLIDQFQNHHIVCGADQTARYLIDELRKTGQDFVVVDRDSEKLKSLEALNIPYIRGDATHDSVLLAAGIERAKGLIAALHSDADNLFVTLTAKDLNPSLRVISKAIEEGSERKLRRAGADGVVMPIKNGAMRMASELLRPSVVTFLDLMLRSQDATIRVESIEPGENCRFLGKTLRECGILEVEGFSVVALKDSDGNYHYNPPKETPIERDTVLIVMGKVEPINEMKRRFD
ncbi:MAG: potassium channel family protein [Bacteroidota bacterium]